MTMPENDMHLNGQAYSNSQQKIIHGPLPKLTMTMLMGRNIAQILGVCIIVISTTGIRVNKYDDDDDEDGDDG